MEGDTAPKQSKAVVDLKKIVFCFVCYLAAITGNQRFAIVEIPKPVLTAVLECQGWNRMREILNVRRSLGKMRRTPAVHVILLTAL